jgi:thiamine kinase-like enzyme
VIDMPNPQFDLYRLVLASSLTRRVFAEEVQLVPRLPRISIQRWTRAAEQIQAAIEQRWGFKIIVLDFLENKSGRENLAIAELRSHDRDPSPHWSHAWVRLNEIAEDEIFEFDRSIVEKLLSDGATGRGPFSRFGWVEEAHNWISAEAGSELTQFTGDLKQLNAAANFALVRFARESAPPIWFKAVRDLSTPEYRITSTLAKLLPEYLPHLMASREDWSAWWMEDAGQSLDEARSGDLFDIAALRLAELQKTSIHHIPALLKSGCGDQRISVLRARIPQMMELIEDAMARQQSSFSPKLGRERLREVRPILEDACFNLEALGIPDTLTHGDINLGNILVGHGCVFIDWAQASIGNPFVTFEQLRAQVAQDHNTAQWTPRMTEIYAESWGQMLSASQINCALAVVPLISVALELCGRWEWLTSGRILEPQFQSYVRGLTRQMDRAVRDLELREIACA